MAEGSDRLAEIEAHRRRYEELKQAGTGEMRALPPPTPRGGAPIAADRIVASDVVPGGWYTTLRLRRGEALRIVNVEGSSAVTLVCWNAVDPSERLNYADTVKVQWTTALWKGRLLLSDMGRVLFSMIEDTGGRHDALVGGSTDAGNRERYGEGSYRSTRDNLVKAAAKLGLARADIPPAITFFAPVRVNGDGGFAWDAEARTAGDFVDLRAEMDVLVALSNCPHPLDPAETYAPGPVEVIRFRAGAPAADDLCRTLTPEAIRAFENTDASLA